MVHEDSGAATLVDSSTVNPSSGTLVKVTWNPPGCSVPVRMIGSRGVESTRTNSDELGIPFTKIVARANPAGTEESATEVSFDDDQLADSNSVGCSLPKAKSC